MDIFYKLTIVTFLIDFASPESTPAKDNIFEELPSLKSKMKVDDKSEIDQRSNMNAFWASAPVYKTKTQLEDIKNHQVVYKPPHSLTRVSKTVASGLNPHFNKNTYQNLFYKKKNLVIIAANGRPLLDIDNWGYFEPFESRPKPVTLVGIRKNGIFPHKNIDVVSKSSEVAELQSPYNDVSNFWLDEPGQHKN